MTNKEVVQRFIEHGMEFLRGDRDHLREFFTADFVFHTPVLVEAGDDHRERFHDDASSLASIVVDMEATVDRIVEEGDCVLAHFTFRGVHDKSYPHATGEIPPTGDRVQARGMSMHRIRDGEIAERWYYTNISDVLAGAARV